MLHVILYLQHRWYHWRSGRGWRCEQCRNRTHRFELPYD